MVDFILYGAYGYTGRLIARSAAEYGLTPLLAGRDAGRLAAVAQETGYPYQVVDLQDKPALEALLNQAPIVLHCAGPFALTARQMHQACLATQTHYLDITGEITAFAQAHKLSSAAQAANIMLLPGVGFDVVPTDCLAAFLKTKLPDATHLSLAFAWKNGGISHGTAKTMLLGLGQGGAVRRDGKITSVPAAHKTQVFPFTAEKSLRAVAIPWGDIFTAYHTTGIPNIETFFAAPLKQQRLMRWSNYFGPLLRLPAVKNYLNRKIEARPAGPSDARRERALAYVYGEAKNGNGRQVAARLTTLEGYTLTAHTALLCTQKVRNGQWKAGYQTPAGLYGPDLVLETTASHRESL
ncbi:MAG: hypothetical protein HC821_01565 [Lewinella sp.]|nr:hypothetical protein [Lewinella sp.]